MGTGEEADAGAREGKGGGACKGAGKEERVIKEKDQEKKNKVGQKMKQQVRYKKK